MAVYDEWIPRVYIDGVTGKAVEVAEHTWQPAGRPEICIERDPDGKRMTVTVKFMDVPGTEGCRLRADAIRGHLGPDVLAALRYLAGPEPRGGA